MASCTLTERVDDHLENWLDRLSTQPAEVLTERKADLESVLDHELVFPSHLSACFGSLTAYVLALIEVTT